jgi:hypothetical protein
MPDMASTIGNFTYPVNGYVTDGPHACERSLYRSMEIENIVQRIEERLRAVKKNATEASREAGLSADAIRNMKRGLSKGANARTLSKLAPVLETTASWLMGEDDAAEPEKPRRVPIVGHVGAGSNAYFVPARLGNAPAPEWASESTVAVEIRGDSLGRSLNGWLAYYDDVRNPVTEDLMGHLCVVGLADGQILIKELRQARQRGYFHLFSNAGGDPILDQKVEWAALVKTLKPK